MQDLNLYETKIATWGAPIIMRASNEHEAEELARIIFKIPTDVEITAGYIGRYPEDLEK